jgi:hypothetical protein
MLNLAFPRAQPDPMPFSFMTLRPLLPFFVRALLAAPVLLTAQTSSSEEERLEKLMADSAQWYVPKTTVSVGFRMLNAGGKVTFGNLGSVDFDREVDPISAGLADRVYDNGEVLRDAPRPEEKDAAGNVITTPGGRYPIFSTFKENVLDSNGNPVLNPDGTNVTRDVQRQTGDLRAYTPGLTRNWGYGYASQLTGDGRLALSTYSASSEGASALKESGASAGVEFQYVRHFSKPANRLQWGVLTGITLNGINSKTAGTVTSTLNSRTDYYSLGGATVPGAPYSGPSVTDYLSSSGELIRADSFETTVPIVAAPLSHTETATPQGVEVDGNWQVKGAYFMVRLGPTIRTRLTSRLGVSASMGVAGAYTGTTYSVTETFQVPDLEGLVIGAGRDTEQTSETKFISGYYADLNLEWVATERTGLFGGFTAQKFDGYDQSVGSRTARIDLGSSVGVRGGVSIKF